MCLQQELPPTSSVTWQRNSGAQGSRGGAGGSAGVRGIGLVASAVVRQVLVVVLEQGMKSSSSLSTSLTALMEAVQASSAVTWLHSQEWGGW